MDTSVCSTLLSTMFAGGSCGSGFSRASSRELGREPEWSRLLSRVSDVERARTGLLTTRRSSRREATGGMSDSSPDVVGVDAEVGECAPGRGPQRGTIASMRTSRMSETEMVESTAISRAMVAERGFVVNTTKYEMALAREKVAGWGSVTYGRCDKFLSVCADTVGEKVD